MHPSNPSQDAAPPPSSQRSSSNASTPVAERNVREVILTDLRVETWFPSFYPEELIGRAVERLFVCKWCFKYTTKVIPFIEHGNVGAARPSSKKLTPETVLLRESVGPGWHVDI